MKPVIKIVKPGKSLDSTDIRDYLLHSDFSMLKYHSDTIHTMTVNAGDTTKLLTIPHGLTYTPKFFVYTNDSGGIFMLPYRMKTLSEEDRHFYAYADNTNIYIALKLGLPHNQRIYPYDTFYSELTDGTVGLVVGNSGVGGKSSAWRFPNIAIQRGQSILSAALEIRHVFTGTGNSDTLFRLSGVAQDNCGDISTGLPPTSAYSDGNQSKVQDFFNFGINVLPQLSEITSRAGWASGNRVGFIVYDRSSPNNSYIGFDGSTTAVLKVLLPGSNTYNFRLLVTKDRII